MFQIYLEPIQQACEELERQFKIFRASSEEVDNVIRVLQTMEGFEEPISRLRDQKRRLQTEMSRMEQMMKGLGNIWIHYRNYENKIIDYCENGMMINRNIMVGMMQLNTAAIDGWNITLV